MGARNSILEREDDAVSEHGGVRTSEADEDVLAYLDCTELPLNFQEVCVIASEEIQDIGHLSSKHIRSFSGSDRSIPTALSSGLSRNPKDYRRCFISSRGNEYFCEIDEEYLTDRFNLTGLNTEVHYYQHALDLITDVFDLDCEDDMRETIEKSARHLYGLVHARYIVTTRGLAKMVEKFKKSDFGRCPRVLCDSHPLLPMSLNDNPGQKSVKLYCAKCEDIYNPKSSRHAAIDGAYFGTSFHNILFQVYPALVPTKSRQRFEPRVFGFRVHAAAALARWQDTERREMRNRLKEAGVVGEGGQLFIEDADSEDNGGVGGGGGGVNYNDDYGDDDNNNNLGRSGTRRVDDLDEDEEEAGGVSSNRRHVIPGRRIVSAPTSLGQQGRIGNDVEERDNDGDERMSLQNASQVI